ncbi:Heavy metal-dependent transcription regulator 2 [Rubrivivax sp. A210]|uniref:Cu(I)-responsive transcriptional regulator n=1 Tax=Rubrivivax sp. A210 TaxID=2772301 RepID=UPI001918ACF9|nr:Cu(I)-responsive transcriptional regulator [Rubrivivax sp. A210]CAD5372355.1 Heavy metal-dependent transcription regulator 2 [Rubrivivax sp. A210]
MNIGEASNAAGISAKMIRHYEAVGLIAAASRTEGGYRQYGDAGIHTLRFIRHARDLGFSIAEIGELVGLWQDKQRPSLQVKALAAAHIQALAAKARELLAMKATLEHLVHGCRGDDRPECPILEILASEDSGTEPTHPAQEARLGGQRLPPRQSHQRGR